jgi:hypothetical protein
MGERNLKFSFVRQRLEKSNFIFPPSYTILYSYIYQEAEVCKMLVNEPKSCNNKRDGSFSFTSSATIQSKHIIVHAC